jgi:hypothetical protein
MKVDGIKFRDEKLTKLNNSLVAILEEYEKNQEKLVNQLIEEDVCTYIEITLEIKPRSIGDSIAKLVLSDLSDSH